MFPDKLTGICRGRRSEDGPVKGRIFFWESGNCSKGRPVVHLCEDIRKSCLLWNNKVCNFFLCCETFV